MRIKVVKKIADSKNSSKQTDREGKDAASAQTASAREGQGSGNIGDYEKWALEQKSKIAVSAKLKAILDKDAESFEFFKKDGIKVNMNEFLSRLIVNYHSSYRAARSSFIDTLKKEILAVFPREDEKASDAALKFVNKAMREQFRDSGDKLGKSVSFKPTEKTKPIIGQVVSLELADTTYSEYFRGMFESYAALPQDEREKIIFAEEYEEIMRAIQNGKKLFIATKKNPSKPFVVSPYAVVSSKEELHCYMLATMPKGKCTPFRLPRIESAIELDESASMPKDKCTPFRLSRIASAIELDESASFTEEHKAMFKRMIENAPQYLYAADEEEAIVELTPPGEKLFKSLYMNRPKPTKVDGNLYHFNSSYMQLKQYFCRFGKEAMIREPAKLRHMIANFHREASDAYAACERDSKRDDFEKTDAPEK